MIEDKKTKREELMEHNISNMKWVAKVINRQDFGDKGFEVITEYNSEKNDLDSIIHKVKLDMITNLRYNYEQPIMIFVKRVDDNIRIQDEVNKMEK
jgi:hypothetical protein